METLTGVRFPVGIGRAVRGVRSGYSLRFSDKLAVSSRKNQKKGRHTAMKRSVGGSGWMVGVVRRGAADVSQGRGERGGNRREYVSHTGVSRVSEACRPPNVRCPPCRTHGRARDHQGRPILSRKRGRERKGKTAAVVDHGRSTVNPTMGTPS